MLPELITLVVLPVVTTTSTGPAAAPAGTVQVSFVVVKPVAFTGQSLPSTATVVAPDTAVGETKPAPDTVRVFPPLIAPKKRDGVTSCDRWN